MLMNKLIALSAYLRSTQTEFADALAQKTLKRVRYLSMVAAPVSAAHIIIFLMHEPASVNELAWRVGIIVCHALQLSTALVILLTTSYARRFTELPVVRKGLNLFAQLVVLLFGVMVAGVDQFVTPAVTPFLLACMVTGTLFLTWPPASLLIHALMYLLFHVVIIETQPDPTVVLSNQVNGLTAVAIATGLSWLLWHQSTTSMRQRNIIARQQHHLEDINAQLEELATRDELTGLANRRLLQMLINEEQAVMQRQNGIACLLLLDIDHFKNVNDHYGHPAGDKLLFQLGQLLTDSVRSSDTVARWGGEEFAILLRGSALEQGERVANQLRKAVEQCRFNLSDDQSDPDKPVHLTVSIGVTQLEPDSKKMLDEAYRRADQALYAAKSAGRNRVFSSPESSTEQRDESIEGHERRTV